MRARIFRSAATRERIRQSMLEQYASGRRERKPPPAATAARARALGKASGEARAAKADLPAAMAGDKPKRPRHSADASVLLTIPRDPWAWEPVPFVPDPEDGE